MANFDLELIYPKAPGDPGVGLDTDNRCYFAYPGLTYTLQVCAIGGDYPYTYELSNAPTGMTIDANTGVITWLDPQTGTHSDIQVTVTDDALATDSETWSIVCGTSGWRFVDATAPDGTGDGTIGDPYQTLDNLYDSGGANNRVYFRTGTYDFTGVPNSSGEVTWNETARPVIWLAYPGESPVIDYELTFFVDFIGECIYVDGLECANTGNHAFRIGPGGSQSPLRYGSVVVNCDFHDSAPGVGGTNSGFLMYRTQTPDQCYGSVIHSCTFTGIDDGTGNSFVKYYAQNRSLLHGCTFSDGDSQEVIAIKAHMTQYTIRACTFETTVVDAISGNMHGDSQSPDEPTTSGEICFNNIKGGQYGVWVNQDSMTLATYIYRNTIQAQVRLYRIDANDGPFVFSNNVIVNADGAEDPFPFGLWVVGAAQDFWTGTGDEGQVTFVTSLTPTGTQNLAGAAADAIVTAGGLLQGTYRTNFLGSWGHELVIDAPGDIEGAHPIMFVGIC